MTAPHTVEDDPIAGNVLDLLAPTIFACTTVERLNGGSSAFTYRGVLKIPLPESGASSIIIKHTEAYIALNPAWALDISRSDYEVIMLMALDTKAPTELSGYRIKTPRTLLEPRPHTLIIEDLPDSVTLEHYLSDSKYSGRPDPRLVMSLGSALGRWLISLHQWGSDTQVNPQMNDLRSELSKSPMKDFKYDINIGRYLGTVDHFPDFAWAERHVYGQIGERIKQDVADEASLIHGDWWPGNILLKDVPLRTNAENLSDIFVVDFEFSHLGCISQDLGQCFAELHIIYHFRKVAAARQFITSISEGYCANRVGGKSDAVAFQVAMHFGIHLVNWPWRVGNWRTSELLPECIKFGNECLLRGHRGDREWFRGGVLDNLFP